jgi:hypothetical protein
LKIRQNHIINIINIIINIIDISLIYFIKQFDTFTILNIFGNITWIHSTFFSQIHFFDSNTTPISSLKTNTSMSYNYSSILFDVLINPGFSPLFLNCHLMNQLFVQNIIALPIQCNILNHIGNSMYILYRIPMWFQLNVER